MLRSPFTAAQWQELEHQALILKYLLAGVPVPPDLLLPIHRSFGSVPACFYTNPNRKDPITSTILLHFPFSKGFCGKFVTAVCYSFPFFGNFFFMGYCSYFGKKLDPEPGRCRRTDGKKWRCSKDAYPDSKYCERHMHRGKNRSRKPVESQTLSQLQSSSSTVTSLTPSRSVSGSVQTNPLQYPITGGGDAQGSNLGSYGVGNKDYRYLNGVKTDLDMHSFISEASGSVKGLGVDSSLYSSSCMLPSQVSSFQLSKAARSSSVLSYPQLHSAKHLGQQHESSYTGSEFDLLQPVKQENNSLRPFFDEWPKTRDLWSDLEDERSNQISFSNTRLSISIPMASSDFSTTASRSSNND